MNLHRNINQAKTFAFIHYELFPFELVHLHCSKLLTDVKAMFCSVHISWIDPKNNYNNSK